MNYSNVTKKKNQNSFQCSPVGEYTRFQTNLTQPCVVVRLLVAELVSAGLMVGPFHHHCESVGNTRLQYKGRMSNKKKNDVQTMYVWISSLSLYDPLSVEICLDLRLASTFEPVKEQRCEGCRWSGVVLFWCLKHESGANFECCVYRLQQILRVLPLTTDL